MKWLAKHFNVDQIAAADFITHRVVEVLRADDTLAAIFGRDWIRAAGIYTPTDYDHFPQLIATPGLALGEPQPSLVAEKVTVYLVAKFQMGANEYLYPDAPGLASLWNQVILALWTGPAKLLNYQRVDGTQVQLVARSNPQTVTTEAERDLDGGQFAMRSVLPWDYEVRLVPETRRIRNLTT